MGSSVIATHLESVLPNLIFKLQIGFFQNRFIGESTRLIYNIMSYAVYVVILQGILIIKCLNLMKFHMNL